MKSIICLLAGVLLAGMTEAGSHSAEPKAKQNTGANSVKNMNAAEAKTLLKENKKVIVLDVRTPEEFAAGHIAGATNVNFRASDFRQKLESLPKDKAYLVHCASGGRSSKARDMMKGLNFQQIYHLDGGITAWEKAGNPVVK